MLFNSHVFLFFFLPLTWVVAVRLRKAGWHEGFIAWLLLASLFFYGWWSPYNLPLIVLSIAVNFALGHALGRKRSRWLLALGVGFNLALLTHFKYQLFFAETFNALTGSQWAVTHLVLPLGISFFTFQQIAWLVDVWRGEQPERSLTRYALFVTFFPQLIAGPIVHLKELLPGLDRHDAQRQISQDAMIGIAIFAIGLAKKVLIADSLAPHASPWFDAVARGESISTLAAWRAALAYSGQLYFDFSGYSDMAVGLARMFGVRLPINFFSPYKAVSITDFWRRWHITLSRFLRDYLYVPLGGNRRGRARTYINLLLTMAIGGLWHGANWTFVLWGIYHGLLLAAERVLGLHRANKMRALRVGVTFLLVMLGWVLFRSADLDSAGRFYAAMLAPMPWAELRQALTLGDGLIALALLLAFFAPNTSELFARVEPGLVPAHFKLKAPRFAFALKPAQGILVGLLLALSVLGMSSVTEFLYFQF